jgi:Na+/proline symporter
MTNFLDMTGTMVIVSYLYMLGPRGIFVEFRGGAVLVLVFMLLWTGKWHYRSRCMTGAEWQIYRFGTGGYAQFARVITAISQIVVLLGMIAYLITGAGLFLPMFMPWSPIKCALVMVGLTTLYTIVSGFYGVVYNDLFQSGVILISVLVISIMAAVKIAGYQGDLSELAYQVTGNSHWVSSWPHWFTEIRNSRGTEYEPMQFLFVVGLWGLIRSIVGGLGTGMDQRYFGARSERDCGVLTFFWTWLMTFRWPMMIGFAVLGLFLLKASYPDQAVLPQSTELIKKNFPGITKEQWAYRLQEIAQNPERYPQLEREFKTLLGGDWASRLQLVSFEGTVNPERVLPAVILMSIPMGLRGLFIASLLAAAMSTLSPQVNTATSYFTRDIWQAYLRPRAGNRELIGISYIFGVLIVAGGFLMAYYVKSINDVWGWITMGLGAGLSVPLLLRLYWWRFNGAGFFWGTLIGLVWAVIQRGIAPHWPPGLTFVVGLCISFAGCVIGTYLNPPTDRPVLEHFYRTTRPFGLWSPLRHILPADVRAAMDRENRNDVLAVPFALLWQITLFMLPMQMVIGAWRSFWPTLGLFAIGLSGVLWFWYRNLPPREVGAYPASVLLGAEQDATGPVLPATIPADVGQPVKV